MSTHRLDLTTFSITMSHSSLLKLDSEGLTNQRLSLRPVMNKVSSNPRKCSKNTVWKKWNKWAYKTHENVWKGEMCVEQSSKFKLSAEASQFPIECNLVFTADAQIHFLISGFNRERHFNNNIVQGWGNYYVYHVTNITKAFKSLVSTNIFLFWGFKLLCL